MTLSDKLLRTLLVIIMTAMSLVVAANVFCRFVLNFSLTWADETAQMLLVWLTFLGAALAVRENSHYALNFLTEKLSGRVKTFFLMMQLLLSLLAIAVLLYFSVIVAWQIRPWMMPATEISRAWVYGACPIGCLLMIYYAVRNTYSKTK